MNFKKVLAVLTLLLIVDLTFIGCSHRTHCVVSPSAAAIDMASMSTISPYDMIMRQVANTEGMDWRLIAAIAHQESRFNPNARSRSGAKGLMQIMNSVAKQFEVPIEDLNDPKINITTAVKLIKRIEKTLRFGSQTAPEDRTRITLACYNAGIGHIIDARRLAVKQGVNHNSWQQLSKYVKLKGTPEWVNDEAVRNGAFNGTETVQFVDKVMTKYDQYCKNYI